ncbi:MAG: leucine-rich repeat domain-containing protein, partial [Clostridium sp.]
MKRKRNQLFVTALTVAMAVSLLSPAEPAAAAKKVKFNVKTLSLTVGKKKTLKIKNAKKKAKWSIKSGKDKIKLQKKKKASVVVAAKKAGSAKVQAKVGKKKYVCKVVVKAKTVKNGTSAGTKTTNKPADTKNATNNPSNGQNNAATQPTNNPSKDNPSKDNPANPTATPAADPDAPKKNEQDVKKLQALIQTLNQKGADISANLDDESVYHWNKEGRLTEIYWGEKEIIGAEMADFNEFTALEILDINNNNISGTFYVGDLANLKELKCYGNKIDKLVLDTNKNLQELDCHNNQISNTIRLNDSKNLERLYCSNNKITELDVSGCDKLQDVDCSNNLMSSLNVSDLPSLKSLNCSRNMLKDDNLILTGSIGLINLDCSLNGTNYDFINLNLAGFTKLESLNCSEQPEDGGTSADDT